MATTNSMTGVVSVNATAPTQVILSPLGPASLVGVTFNSSSSGSTVGSSYAVNDETQNFAGSANSFCFANNVEYVIKGFTTPAGTLTLCANASNVNYAVRKITY